VHPSSRRRPLPHPWHQLPRHLRRHRSL